MSIAGSLTRRGGRVVAAFALLVLVLLVIGVWAASRWLWREAAAGRNDDPRLTFPTPFRNVRPGVGYVGDARCATCHPVETAAYRDHPMGRSLAPVAAASPLERYGREAHNPFDFGALQFVIERQGDRVFHRE